jgi:arginase
MKLSVLEVPYDSGRYLERTGAGPRRLIEAGLIDALRRAGHDVEHEELRLAAGFTTEATSAVALMSQASTAVRRTHEAGRVSVVLSGNCGVAVGGVCGLGPSRTGVLWFDAHGDLNTPETSTSGFFDGMTFAMLLGRGFGALAATIPHFEPLPVAHAALLGARDLDPPEQELVTRERLLALSVERLRTAEGRNELATVASRVERLYVHVDLDALDPRVLRANQLPAPDGLLVPDVVEAVRAAARRAPVAAIGFASYDPAADERDPGPAVVRELLEGLLPGARA